MAISLENSLNTPVVSDAPKSAEKWRLLGLLASLIALGMVLRLIRLDFQPLWFDEGYSFYFAASSVRQLIADTAVDIHPPFYYLLLKTWMTLFGTGVVQARALSVMVGTASIPLLFLLGRQLGGDRLGLWAAALLVISPFHIYYSQEVRMYGLVTFFSLLAGLLTLLAFERGNDPGWWIGAGFSIAAALYTQYYAVFTPLVLTLYLLLRRDLPRRRIVPWMATLAGAFLIYLPWLLYAIPRLIVYIQYKVGMDQDAPLAPIEFLRRALAAYGAGHLEGWLSDWPWLGLIMPALLLIGLLFMVGLQRAGRLKLTPRDQRPVTFTLIFLLVPLSGAYVINLAAPFNPPRSERLLLFALPAFYLLGAYVLSHLPRASGRWGPLVIGLSSLICLAIGVISLTAFYTVPRYAEDDYRPVAAEIAARSRPDDAVICVLPWQVGYFQAYLDPNRPALIETPSQIYPGPRQFWADDPALMAADLDDLMVAHSRLWLPAYLASGSPLEGMIAGYLDESYIRTLSEWYGTTHLSLHVSVPLLETVDAEVDFAGRLHVDEIALNALPVETAYGTIVFESRWEKTGPVEPGHRIVLRLADDEGRAWGQWDLEPLGGRQPFSAWAIGETHRERLGLLVDAGTPPGHYVLKLSVRGEDDMPLQIVAGAGEEPAVEAALGEVEVVRFIELVPPAVLQMDNVLHVDFNDQVRLLGYDLTNRAFTPGEELKLTLFWQSLRSVEEDLVVFVQLLDREEALVAAAEAPPTAGFFPTSRWEPGDLIRDEQALRLPASLPDGTYRLIAGLFKTADHERLPTTVGVRRHGDHVKLGEVSIRGRPHDFEAPAPEHPMQAQFDDVALLVGYDTDVSASEYEIAIHLTLHWQVLKEMAQSYKVFVHLYDEEGRRVAQHDSEPGLGQFPTSGWLPGEFVKDSHPLTFDPEKVARLKEVWVGLYDSASGRRLPVVSSGGTILDDHLVIAFSMPAVE